MRRGKQWNRRGGGLGVTVLVGLGLGGCASSPSRDAANEITGEVVIGPKGAVPTRYVNAPVDVQGGVTTQAAYRPRPAATVEWLEMPAPQVAAAPAPVVNGVAQADAASAMAAEPAGPNVQDTPTPVPTVEPMDRGALIKRLQDELMTTDAQSPAMRRALQAVALSMVSVDKQIDPRVLEPLNEAQRGEVARFQLLLAGVAERLEAGEPVDAAAVLQELAPKTAQGDGSRPVGLRTVRLCRSVSGFGVYEPFESYRFQAGRSDNRAIVYAELEDYVVKQIGDEHEVKLEQEIVLYTQGDGLLIWRQPAQTVVDRARRVRRDFYVVQLIQLPANLGVGRYALKVRVTDLHSGAIDEETLTLEVVADAALLKPTVEDEKPKESKLPEPPDVRSILPDLMK